MIHSHSCVGVCATARKSATGVNGSGGKRKGEQARGRAGRKGGEGTRATPDRALAHMPRAKTHARTRTLSLITTHTLTHTHTCMHTHGYKTLTCSHARAHILAHAQAPLHTHAHTYCSSPQAGQTRSSARDQRRATQPAHRRVRVHQEPRHAHASRARLPRMCPPARSSCRMTRCALASGECT